MTFAREIASSQDLFVVVFQLRFAELLKANKRKISLLVKYFILVTLDLTIAVEKASTSGTLFF